MFTRPEVGKVVTVTSDWTDNLTSFATNVRINHGQSTQTGTVVNSDPKDDPASFRMTTGLPYFPVRLISLDKVVSLEYDDGSAADKKVIAEKVDEETWVVEGSKGASYVVTRKGNRWHCECLGWQFRQNCKHVNEKKQEVLNRD